MAPRICLKSHTGEESRISTQMTGKKSAVKIACIENVFQSPRDS